MQVVFHIGAHCSDQDILVKSLLKNRDMLLQQGVAVPGPGRYRKVLGEMMVRLRGAQAAPETREVLVDTLLDDTTAHRIVLSNESFISMPSRAIENGKLYPRIAKSAWLRNLFPDAECAFAITLQNIATFVPALHDMLSDEQIDESFPDDFQPIDLNWADVVQGLRDANPGVPILVWCHEDAPILWPEIMRHLCELPGTTSMEGANDLARRIMSNDGNRALRARLNAAPPGSEAERRGIVAAYLSEHALPEVMEQEIHLPGWTDELTEALTRAYDEDVARLAGIDGVRLLLP